MRYSRGNVFVLPKKELFSIPESSTCVLRKTVLVVMYLINLKPELNSGHTEGKSSSPGLY